MRGILPSSPSIVPTPPTSFLPMRRSVAIGRRGCPAWTSRSTASASSRERREAATARSRAASQGGRDACQGDRGKRRRGGLRLPERDVQRLPGRAPCRLGHGRVSGPQHDHAVRHAPRRADEMHDLPAARQHRPGRVRRSPSPARRGGMGGEARALGRRQRPRRTLGRDVAKGSARPFAVQPVVERVPLRRDGLGKVPGMTPDPLRRHGDLPAGDNGHRQARGQHHCRQRPYPASRAARNAPPWRACGMPRPGAVRRACGQGTPQEAGQAFGRARWRSVIPLTPGTRSRRRCRPRRRNWSRSARSWSPRCRPR